jgi:very-short-patch-repair endonuclease
MSASAWSGSDERHGEVLIAIMNAKADFEILREQLWYRVPADSRPRPWPPEWLAVYHTKVFGADAYTVQHYGRVKRIDRAPRREIFPAEPLNLKSDREYFLIHLHTLERLPTPIVSPRPRRNPFIPTTWRKFKEAGQINDLFDESPLEDRLWEEFQARRIPAERQWQVEFQDKRYYLDFALFCNKGKIDVETDGTTWHRNRSREDNERNNAVESAGWHVLRFDTQQIQETADTYCISKVEGTINTLGGPLEETWAPRLFYELPEGPAQQLALLEEQSSYDLD